MAREMKKGCRWRWAGKWKGETDGDGEGNEDGRDIEMERSETRRKEEREQRVINLDLLLCFDREMSELKPQGFAVVERRRQIFVFAIRDIKVRKMR
jgi:hypothetical protein